MSDKTENPGDKTDTSDQVLEIKPVLHFELYSIAFSFFVKPFKEKGIDILAFNKLIEEKTIYEKNFASCRSYVQDIVSTTFQNDGLPLTGCCRTNEALRCVLWQRAMQANADSFLGDFKYYCESFYASELSPHGKNVNLNELGSSKEFLSVLRQMGQATAKIHAISDRDADASLIPYSADREIANVLVGKEE